MKQPTRLQTPPTLLAVFAHPDDESFRSGGTLALLAEQGVRVQLLTATRGEAGSRGEPALCTAEELPNVRENELRCACQALGILPPILLDYEDGRLPEADPEPIISQIQTKAREISAQVMLSFGSAGISGHPDHITIGRLAAEAFHRTETLDAFYTPVVPRSIAEAVGMKQIQSVPDEAVSLEVDVSTIWRKKMAAISCHRTQLDQSPILKASSEKQRLFLGKEHFLRTRARSEVDFIQKLVRNKKEGHG